MSWFLRSKTVKEKLIKRKVRIPEGVWIKCDNCKHLTYNTEIERNLNVCTKCEHHHYIPSLKRIDMLVDEGSFVEKDANLSSVDTLGFKDTKKYTDRLKTYTKKTDMKDGVRTGSARIGDIPVEIAVMEYAFMGGSMGSVIGEKIVRSIERAIDSETPVIIVACSGGARMQEGILSLMQMAKISSALSVLSEKALLFISVLTNPTMGGVTASFAMLGDIIIAEQGALIGFAGPRVVEQTIQKKLPEGFQRAEFLEEHGMVDIVIHRKKLTATISKLLLFLRKESGA